MFLKIRVHQRESAYKFSVHRNGVDEIGVGPDSGIRRYRLLLRSTDFCMSLTDL